MAKGMPKTQLIRFMAEKLELTNKQSATIFTTLAETAVKETKKNGEFTIPGIGKLVKAERKARIGHQDQGQDRREVSHRQGGQRHHRAPQEVGSDPVGRLMPRHVLGLVLGLSPQGRLSAPPPES